MPRTDLLDGRVDVVLYFLPINGRISEDDMDTIAINAMAEYAPVIPVMCRVRLGLLWTPECTLTMPR
jgi:septin family protein